MPIDGCHVYAQVFRNKLIHAPVWSVSAGVLGANDHRPLRRRPKDPLKRPVVKFGKCVSRKGFDYSQLLAHHARYDHVAVGVKCKIQPEFWKI